MIGLRLLAIVVVVLIWGTLTADVSGYPQLMVSIFTNSMSYNPGESVTLYGYVKDTAGTPVPYATVSIQVNDPIGSPLHIMYVNSYTDGGYSDTFNLPMSAGNGMYTAYVTAYAYQWNPSNSLARFSVPRITLYSLQSRTFGAAPNRVYFIYPDYGHAQYKLPGVGLAALSDWSAMGILYGMCSNIQNDGLDTNGILVDLSSGSPVFSEKSVVVMGGRGVHNVVYYYEDRKLAPLYFSCDAATYYLKKRDGSTVGSISISELTDLHRDIFVLEAFTDLKGNAVLIAYGITWKGTFAAGLYLKSVIAPSLASYSHAWYVFRWDDLNGDGMIDLSEITQIANGD